MNRAEAGEEVARIRAPEVDDFLWRELMLRPPALVDVALDERAGVGYRVNVLRANGPYLRRHAERLVGRYPPVRLSGQVHIDDGHIPQVRRFNPRVRVDEQVDERMVRDFIDIGGVLHLDDEVWVRLQPFTARAVDGFRAAGRELLAWRLFRRVEVPRHGGAGVAVQIDAGVNPRRELVLNEVLFRLGLHVHQVRAPIAPRVPRAIVAVIGAGAAAADGGGDADGVHLLNPPGSVGEPF